MEHKNTGIRVAGSVRRAWTRNLLWPFGFQAALGLFTLAPVAVAQTESFNPRPSVKQAVRILTGQSKREWVFTRWAAFMGDDQECSSGESHIYYSAGTLIVRRCVDDMLVEQTHGWKIRKAGGMDLEIVIDAVPYTLRFFRTDEGIKMRQHDRARDQSDETTDRWFVYTR